MSVVVVSNYGQNQEAFDQDELLEKCGEIFLEKQLGNLIYLCTLCDDRFKDVGVFSKHLSDVHISVDNCISFDPYESDEEASEKYDQVEEYIKQETEHSEESSNEEIFNIIDSSNTVLDIEVYEDNDQLEMELKAEDRESLDLETTECQEELKTEQETKNPIEIEENSVEEDNLTERGHELEATDTSDKEILHSKIRCKYCGEQFEYVKDLRKHDCGLKKGKKLHYCSECGKVFKKKSGLDIHMMIHNGEKPHKCDICGAAYACKQNLIVHVRRHTGEKPFQCDFCERRFASSTEKISHMRTHTGERPFVCDMCGKAHTSSSQLTEHMHRHLDIRNYVCEICEKRFRNSYNLRMHRLTHVDAPRKFSCEHCPSAFKTQSNLLQHIKIHQKVKKYVCKICGRAFAQHPGLYSHMKSHAIFK